MNGYFRVNIFSNFKTGLPKYNVSLICLLDASLSKYSNLLFALNIEKNSTHGSDSAENAVFEISYFFSETEILS